MPATAHHPRQRIKLVAAPAAIVLLTGGPLAAQTDAYREFQAFMLKAAKTPSHRVAYRVSTSDNPRRDMVLWRQGSTLRMDADMNGRQVRLYQSGDRTTTCFSEGGRWNCLAVPNSGSPLATAAPGLAQVESARVSPESYQGRIARAGTRTVAGEPTTCFKVTEPQDNNATWLSCYSDKHGVPLHMQGQNSKGAWEMTATAFQTPVDPSAFAPPATPQALPNFPGGAIPGF